MFRIPTFHHPRLKIWDANDRGDAQSSNGRNRFVHCSVCEGIDSPISLRLYEVFTTNDP